MYPAVRTSARVGSTHSRHGRAAVQRNTDLSGTWPSDCRPTRDTSSVTALAENLPLEATPPKISPWKVAAAVQKSRFFAKTMTKSWSTQHDAPPSASRHTTTI